MKKRITAIIAKFTNAKDDQAISASLDLIADLGIDSVTLLQIISELEVKFSITFDDVDLDIKNFQTLDSIYSLLANKCKK